MEYNKTIVYTCILYIGYGLLLFLPAGNVQIPVVYEDTSIYWTSISLGTLIDLSIAPIFMFCILYLIRKAIIEQPIPESSEPSQRKKDIIKFLLFGAGIVLIIGITMHAVANLFNGILNNPVPPTEPLHIAIYWFDEVLGHKLIHFGLYGVLIGLMILQYWHRKEINLSKPAKVGLYFWAAAIGAVYSLAGAEGQAAFDILVISIILSVVILYYVRFKGLKLKENPLTHFMLVFSVSIIITLIVYGIIAGFVPGYPFFLQPPFT